MKGYKRIPNPSKIDISLHENDDINQYSLALLTQMLHFNFIFLNYLTDN